ncbi:MAG: lysophospholipase, partial [Bacteroidales bacterium]|nr:lysophospholipase [Bacteroidales bacterium]
KIFVLGHSWGGTLTAKYMTTGNLQNNLSGWIEVDGAHDNPKNNIEAVKMFINVANEQIALGNHIEDWQGILDWASAIDTTNISEEQKTELNQNAFKVEEWLKEDNILQESEEGGNSSNIINPVTNYFSGNATNRMLSDEVEATSLTNDLHKITIPVLVLWGKYDLVVTPTLGYDTYNKVSSTVKNFVIFEKSGHSPMNNEWRKFTDEILQFVDDNS